jgi:hypothetical protein
MHALVLSSATFAQAAWFFHRTRMERARPRPSSRSPLLGEDQADAPTGASLPTRVGLAAMAIATLWEITSLTFGRTLLLDFLYFTSSVKLVVSIPVFGDASWVANISKVMSR